MNVLDLFSGIGGFKQGLLEAGFKFNWSGHSEIDKYAKTIYGKHFHDSIELPAIESVGPELLPKIDIVTFGFPCQDLSIAGKRGGLKASRSGLFFEAMRIIRAKRPSYFIFENVKGLFSSNGGKDWFNVLREVAGSGYDGQWQLLNTRWFLPQNRERIYFVGHVRGECRPEIFPIGETSKRGHESRGIYEENQRRIPQSEERQKTVKYSRDTCNNQSGVNSLPWNESYPNGRIKNKKISTIRKLTPLECERLQGFPDNWTKYGADGEIISDTQRYKCIGNAVSVPVVKAIGEKLIKCFP